MRLVGPIGQQDVLGTVVVKNVDQALVIDAEVSNKRGPWQAGYLTWHFT